MGFTDPSIYGFGGGLFFISYALLEVPSGMAGQVWRAALAGAGS